jgi:hypothetical protein
MKPCGEHSGVVERIDALSTDMTETRRDIASINEKLVKISEKLAKWGGIIMAISAIPSIGKAIEWLTPIASAFTGN